MVGVVAGEHAARITTDTIDKRDLFIVPSATFNASAKLWYSQIRWIESNGEAPRC